MTVPSVRANGASIPVLGLGTWQLRGDTAAGCVEAALDAGYRHIDTAAMYGNETEVGEAIRGHAVSRAEIFVTTKVWSSDSSEGRLQRSAEASLKRLGLDQVDLLLIHWPNMRVRLKEQIGALCDARRRGLARHIGISNFPVRFVETAVSVASEPLVTNQVEHHPWLDQTPLFEVCGRHGISITSYSPIGRGALLQERAIGEIAKEKGRTPAQIVLRWHVQQPMNIAIPRSSRPERVAENINVFDFELNDDEMRRISGLARPDGRLVDGAVDWDGDPP